MNTEEIKETIIKNIETYFKVQSNNTMVQIDPTMAEAAVFCVKIYNIEDGSIDHEDFGYHTDIEQDVEELVVEATYEIIKYCELDESTIEIDVDTAFDIMYEIENR